MWRNNLSVNQCAMTAPFGVIKIIFIRKRKGKFAPG